MIEPKHPRATSLKIRDQLAEGVKIGITSTQGLIAHGRGEAFDYLIGEKTQEFAEEAISASAATLLLAKHPVLSVNGNSAALVPEEYVKLAEVLDCPIEINLFHRTKEREEKIKKHLIKFGAKEVLGVGDDASAKFSGIASPRQKVSPNGIVKADVVFVPLEDGDRTEALIKSGKKVITVDLNPLSRTAQKATITIVDNLVRVMPLLINQINRLKEKEIGWEKLIEKYNNRDVLEQATACIRGI